MPACPHCPVTVTGRNLGRQARFGPYPVCDRCGARFSIDRATRRRQMIAIGVALVSMVLTITMYFEGTAWLLPSMLSYLLLGAIIWHGNRLLYLVPWPEDDAGPESD